MSDIDNEINDLLKTPEENCFKEFEKQGRRKNGEQYFQLYFWLHKISESKLPDSRITTYAQLSKFTGIGRKVLGDYINSMSGLGIFIISYDRGTGGRKEKKIVVKEKKYWNTDQKNKILSIFNWSKSKWE